jgi:hypothetical protein
MCTYFYMNLFSLARRRMEQEALLQEGRVLFSLNHTVHYRTHNSRTLRQTKQLSCKTTEQPTLIDFTVYCTLVHDFVQAGLAVLSWKPDTKRSYPTVYSQFKKGSLLQTLNSKP